MSGGRMHSQLFNEGDNMCVLSYLDLSGLVGNLSVCLKPGPNCPKYREEFREHPWHSKLLRIEKNKTKYFRLRLSDEVSTERPETDLRLTWDWLETDLKSSWRNRCQKLQNKSSRQTRTGRTNERTDGDCDSLSSLTEPTVVGVWCVNYFDDSLIFRRLWF